MNELLSADQLAKLEAVLLARPESPHCLNCQDEIDREHG
jgi:hypothetical protein